MSSDLPVAGGDRWLAILATLRPDGLPDAESLRTAMHEVLARGDGGASWQPRSEDLARHVALCVAETDDILAALRGCHAADLALALACAGGDAAALSEFRRRFEPDAERVVRKYPALEPERADVVQDIFARLLVARPDAPPRIADYRGAGPLQGWVRVAALRLTLDRVRALGRQPDSDAGQISEQASQPSLRSVEDRYVQHAFGDAIRESLEAAFAKLTPRERNLLRHHVVQGLTIDQIAPIYGVHRATIARWLERARASLATAAREVLVERHGVAASEVHSVMRCVRSQVDLSVGRLLGA